MSYCDLELKQPVESEDYERCSDFIVRAIEKIMADVMDSRSNKIIINTNLKYGIPMENINKIAGPFIEAWAFEIFSTINDDRQNRYDLINVEAGERLNMADIILQFKKARYRNSAVTAHVDVKATSKDIENSGKSPNIMSFSRIRSAYVEDPDYVFIILCHSNIRFIVPEMTKHQW